MIIYKDYITFLINGEDVNLISDTVDAGINTVAEIGERYYYLGHELPNISAAIFAWQKINDLELSDEEFRQVLIDNGFIDEGTKSL